MNKVIDKACFVALLCVTLLPVLEGCAGQSPTSVGARTPDRFFSDLQTLVESGDLGDEKYVARTFRLKVTAQPVETVINPKTSAIGGTSSRFLVTPKSVETQIYEDRPKASYGQFRPNGSGFEKSSFSETINEAEICLKKDRFVATWGEGVPQWNPSFQGQITYKFSGRSEFEMYLLFSKTGCVHEIKIFQNRGAP